VAERRSRRLPADHAIQPIQGDAVGKKQMLRRRQRLLGRGKSSNAKEDVQAQGRRSLFPAEIGRLQMELKVA